MGKITTYGTCLVYRLLDISRKYDYLVLSAFSFIPIVISFYLGIDQERNFNGTVYSGYVDCYNWLAFVFILPFSLYLLRKFSFYLAGDITNSSSYHPPVACLMTGYEKSSNAMATNFRAALLKPKFLLISLLLAVFIHVLDMADIFQTYLSYWTADLPIHIPSDHDWTVIFLTGTITPLENILFLTIPYLSQLITATLGCWLLILLFNHNLIFLRSIYQRRFSTGNAKPKDIVIDLEDSNRCFGFRSAYKAFNIQIIFLSIVGILMLVSRFANVSVSQSAEMYKAITSLGKLFEGDLGTFINLLETLDMGALFPDIGQIILIFLWCILFLVVSMPSLVKLRPFLGARIEWLIELYLREFLPDSNLDWDNISSPSNEEVNSTAKKFANNSFWPTGDNRAKVLFWFSFFVMYVLAFPLHPDSTQLVKFFCYYFGLLFLASATAAIFLKFLSFPIQYVDQRLVDKK